MKKATPTKPKMSLRDLLRHRLELLGISQAELARRAGFNAQFISDIASGKKETIRKDAVFKLALGLGVSPLSIFRILSPSFDAGSELQYTDNRQISSPITDRLFSEEALASRFPNQSHLHETFPIFVSKISLDERAVLIGRSLRLYRWPTILGPATGSYGLVYAENRLPFYRGIPIASPQRSIRIGDMFLGFVCFEQSHPAAWIFKYHDSDQSAFYLGVDGSPDSVELPRGALVRAHKIVAIIGEGQQLLSIQEDR